MKELTASERYQFLTLYLRDFHEAMRTAVLVKRRSTRELRAILLQYLVVAYARPFSGNRSATGQFHRLQSEAVPNGYQTMHDLLIKQRNGFFAHTDLNAYLPTVIPWTHAGERTELMLMYSCPKSEQLPGGHLKFPQSWPGQTPPADVRGTG